MALTQSNRLIRMTKGPLGPDEVVVTRFSGHEAISRPFSFEIEFISTRLDLKPSEIVGAEIAIELDRRDTKAQPIAPRHFHGYISRFAAGTVEFKDPGLHKYRHYRAEMVPWLWFLTQTARCFLYFPEKEEKSIFEVIEAVINRAKSDLHITPLSDLQGIDELKSRKVKHCVQYRETDFNFVSRTMEKYGVFYYFKFEDRKHTLVLDMKKNYPVCEEAEVVYASVGGPQPIADRVTSWQHDYEFVPGKWSHTDYNFETPSTSLNTSAPKLPSVDIPPADKYEVYDYPGGYAAKSDGEADARIRQEEKEVQHNLVDGSSTCRTFTAGYKFALTSHPDADVVSEQGKSYLLTSVEHSASQPGDDTGDGAAASYDNRFTCLVDSVQFRPARRTPWPVISGVQTAVVVGPAGDEIYTDKYGQVKVQFHWDRQGKRDENSSCWIRVSQMWAGKGWGSVSTPRIGHEVIVDFLEGDPDQPIILGSVHNAENAPPHTGVVSGLKSNTHKGEGYNAMSFDDTAGKEKITVHGQYDMDTTIVHNETRTVKTGTQAVTVKGDTSLTVQTGNRIVTVESANYEVSAAQAVKVYAEGAGVQMTGESNGVTVMGSGGIGVDVTGDPNVELWGEAESYVGSPLTTIEGTTECGITAPNVVINGDKQLVVTSPLIDIGQGVISIHGSQIVLAAGNNGIEIGAAGVTINGGTVTVAGGTVNIVGGMVKIN